jgi:hypothetical protein
MLCAGFLSAALMSASSASAPPPSAEILSVADGQPCSLIRGTTVYWAGPGVRLKPGDLIATEAGSLAILAFKDGAAVRGLLAIGPSSRLYWMERPDRVTLAVIAGWVKVDTRTPGQPLELQVEGPHLGAATGAAAGAATGAGSFVLHVGSAADEIFHESGSMRLWTRTPDGARTNVASGPSQFSHRSVAGPLSTRIGPPVEFVDAMPAPFRDPLPVDLASRSQAAAEPERIREVGHDDVADWLAAPRDWRRELTRRFRLRHPQPTS